jgi:hypothetical protein
MMESMEASSLLVPRNRVNLKTDDSMEMEKHINTKDKTQCHTGGPSNIQNQLLFQQREDDHSCPSVENPPL